MKGGGNKFNGAILCHNEFIHCGLQRIDIFFRAKITLVKNIDGVILEGISFRKKLSCFRSVYEVCRQKRFDETFHVQQAGTDDCGSIGGGIGMLVNLERGFPHPVRGHDIRKRKQDRKQTIMTLADIVFMNPDIPFVTGFPFLFLL